MAIVNYANLLQRLNNEINENGLISVVFHQDNGLSSHIHYCNFRNQLITFRIASGTC